MCLWRLPAALRVVRQPRGQTCRNAMTHYAATEDVLREIRRQSMFYRYSGGGVTFSGGEATAQPVFLREMVDALYDEGFNLALEPAVSLTLTGLPLRCKRWI